MAVRYLLVPNPPFSLRVTSQEDKLRFAPRLIHDYLRFILRVRTDRDGVQHYSPRVDHSIIEAIRRAKRS